ncbi:MAG: hypothetical protein HW380_3900, partial [Magnetococcales bacterium]|nr:hypothetical protein [Magnetococcales bacterium]
GLGAQPQGFDFVSLPEGHHVQKSMLAHMGIIPHGGGLEAAALQGFGFAFEFKQKASCLWGFGGEAPKVLVFARRA